MVHAHVPSLLFCAGVWLVGETLFSSHGLIFDEVASCNQVIDA
ncbi:hypothetical protein [Chitinophaga rhizophila]|nr:hypothetical protein [Chitinophaga rhizophila]